ncbi:MAG: T9SS type A sorting domain-containing protein [Flavobacteriales bacterium]|nr:T9SS type A sorting domain-containing protein [Flavobacteriales bacterium]
MNKYVPAFLGLLASSSLCAQFDISQIQYWIGAGADTSVMVVDFQDGSATPSYAWGYLHNGGTAEDMINAIAAADVNFSIDVVGGFLNSVTYGTQEAIGGAPDYWSTWSGTSIATFALNNGLAEALGNGDWLGCSYTDFNPPLEPGEPIPAMAPTAIMEAASRTSLQVYPQPATYVLNLATGMMSNVDVLVHSVIGEQVYSSRTSAGITTIDVSSWPKGVYVLKAGTATRTILVQ